MHPALSREADLAPGLRAPRLACVLDPALMLSAPQALLLVRQLACSVDLWVCPALWRLLDASDFFVRSPQRLLQWLALPDDHPARPVRAALELCSRWRGHSDLSALGLYWVGGHHNESYLPAQGPRQVPTCFEALAGAWLAHVESAGAGDGKGHGAQADGAAAGGPPHGDGAIECAALAVALQGVPVLTLASSQTGHPPALLNAWHALGLAGTSWQTAHAAAARAERRRWWQAITDSGATATVAAAMVAGLRLGLAQVVAPTAQFPPARDDGALQDDWWAQGASTAWQDTADDAATSHALATAASTTAWWRDAQALWMNL